MDPIYVTGHKNPDTDSIVSAMAYAALRNALGDREYVAARLGAVSDETQRVLDRFGFEAPILLRTMRTQVRDLDYDTPPLLGAGVTVSRAWDMLRTETETRIAALPVTDENGGLLGMLTQGDIAEHDMESISNPHIHSVPVFNLLSAVEGHIINDAGNMVDTVSGDLTIALPQAHGETHFERNTIVLCGQQPDTIERAINDNVNCLILCQAELDDRFKEIPTETCIITTPLDAYRAARMIFHAFPVEHICNNQELITFHLDEYIDDVREEVLKNRYRSYPILDENEKVIGTLSRYHLIRPRRKRVFLVDHNEAAQSVPGLDQAEIIGIIDHHRLADIQTLNPIFFRNETVGSTATIVAGMYEEKGLMPTAKMAGLLAAAIVSDTVMFKSPTCTPRDVKMAERMARIANVSLEELGKYIFSAGNKGERDSKDLFYSDYKQFHIAGHNLAISQITCVDSLDHLEHKDEFLQIMREDMRKNKFDLVLLMLTDVLKEGTQLLYVGDEEIIHTAFNVEGKENTVFLPKIMSRKKQIIPTLTILWG